IPFARIMIRFLLLHCLILSFMIASANTTSITTDQQALLALKGHITDDPANFLARNWNTSSSVCNWTGITCDVRTYRVTALNISGLNLTVTIPSELGNLSSLQTLDLSFNWFSGSIPASIFNMSSLLSINFINNALFGELPPNFCNHLSNLESLFLKSNMFHGKIPSTLSSCKRLRETSLSLNDFFWDHTKRNWQRTIPYAGHLFQLQWLDLSDNQLSGSLPSFKFKMPLLQFLDLSSNRLSTELPTNVFHNLPFLEELYLSNNMFYGEIPSDTPNCSYLRILVVQFNNFSGAIPKEISNLTKLEKLDLQYNRLQGTILYVGHLLQLQWLDLSDNQLSGSLPSFKFKMPLLQFLDLSSNRLSAELPTNVFHNLPFLEELYLSNNMFYGEIPSDTANCSYLRILVLRFNNFSGAIPKEISNLTKLEKLDLQYNRLQGEIPHEIGNLHNLELMAFGFNKLVGVVPATIFNVSTLKSLYLYSNSLSGRLPSSADIQLPNLEELILWGNNFCGTIPSFIFNASKLSTLELQKNSFSGFIPNTFGNLRNLKRLGLNDNYLTSSTPELSFLSSLSNCKYLEYFSFSSNPLGGILPRAIGNLSQSIEVIGMFNCNISGSIPEEINNLTNLIAIYLGGNKLNGSISIALGKLQKLQLLGLEDNQLEGSIPYDLCRLAALFQLDLGDNKLSGFVPSCFGNLTNLRKLYLGSNQLTYIPLTLWNLKYILYLNLSSNSFTIPLPSEIGNLEVLVQIDLSMNNFSGAIPTTIGGLKDLQYLFLEYNRLQGSIPDFIGGLINLKSLDLSNNNLSGAIPISLEKLLDLQHINVSFNKLEGEIPREGPFRNFSIESFKGNELLCGMPNLHVPPCRTGIHHTSRKNDLLIGIVLPLSTIFMMVVILLILRYRKRGKPLLNDANMPPLANQRRFTYLELFHATNGFSANNIIGRGGIGSIYKARIQDGMEVAVKVFDLQYREAFKSFDNECDMMKLIRHRNLIKIISSCSNDDFKALYGREGRVSTNGDVYSFGIMLIETFTRKKPTDEIFSGEMTLKRWVNDLLPISVMEVVDANLLSQEDKHFVTKEQCVSFVFDLAMKCVVESPEERINTKEIVTRLIKIRDSLLKNLLMQIY
ncbi:hypothetical protein CICLE_v10033336mg, partial [Citrus x clementina]